MYMALLSRYTQLYIRTSRRLGTNEGAVEYSIVPIEITAHKKYAKRKGENTLISEYAEIRITLNNQGPEDAFIRLILDRDDLQKLLDNFDLLADET